MTAKRMQRAKRTQRTYEVAVHHADGTLDHVKPFTTKPAAVRYAASAPKMLGQPTAVAGVYEVVAGERGRLVHHHRGRARRGR